MPTDQSDGYNSSKRLLLPSCIKLTSNISYHNNTNVCKVCHQQKLNILISTTFVFNMILEINILIIVANDYNFISLTVGWKKINMDIFALS